MEGFSADNSVARPSHKAKPGKTNNADGVKNVAAIQIVSGLVCITLQVILVCYYRSHNNEGLHDGVTLFTLTVGSFGSLAGVFGCMKNRHIHVWINYVYVGMSMGVIGSGVLYFVSVYWDFYAALKSSNAYYTILSNGVHQQELAVEQEQEPMILLPTPDDEVHFWLRGALFLCVITQSLFSVAGVVLILSYRRCASRKNNKKNKDNKSLLVGGQ